MLCQMILKLQSAHPGQLHVENEARRLLQTAGSQKRFGGIEERDGQINGLDKSTHRRSYGIIIVYNRNQASR